MARKNIPLLERVGAILPGRRSLLLAVSGGIDSVCLLDMCFKLSRMRLLRLGVAHVDHGLRQDSSSDSDFVRALAQGLKLPFYLRKLEPAPGCNVESWARERRYQYFAKLQDEYEFDFVVTAHNADDVAETLLMRLISNRPLRTIAAQDKKRALLRPLIDISRSELEQYAAENRLEFVTDITNQDPAYLRNRVRLELLPLLENRFEPRIKRLLSSQARKLDQDTKALEELGQRTALELSPLVIGDRQWLQRARRLIKAQPEAVGWRAVERLLYPYYGYLVGRTKALEFMQVLNGERLGLEISGGPRIQRLKEGLFFFIPQEQNSEKSSDKRSN